MSAHRSLIASLLLLLAPLADWPEFRGPRGDGHTLAAGLPLRWSESENVRWKTPIPHRGWSTPVILGSQVWLTTATADGRDFYALALDAGSGRVLIERRLFQTDAPEPLGNSINGYASPSPVTEADRVYVHFGSYGTACLEASTGRVIWSRRDLPCRHFRGPASSPILHGDLLILTMDGVDLQYLVALDKRTGRTVWKTDRTAEWNDLDAQGRPADEGDQRKAFSTPIIVEVNGQRQLISAGSKAAYGYDPQTGREIWKVRYPGFSSSARPVFGSGLAFISTGFGRTELLAIRPDGRGDVTDTHVSWRTNRGAPRLPSPLVAGDLLFMVSDNGILTCVEASTGKEHWKERLGGEFFASLLFADGRLYCFNQDGEGVVVRAAREFEVLARNTLASGLMASPAVSGRSLYLRTKTHLYRIESK